MLEQVQPGILLMSCTAEKGCETRDINHCNAPKCLKHFPGTTGEPTEHSAQQVVLGFAADSKTNDTTTVHKEH